MPTTADAPLSGTTARRERDAILELCATADGDALLEGLSERLRRIIPFKACFWSATDPVTMLATSPARVENMGEEYCSSYWEREFLCEDFIRFTDIAREPRPVATLYDATGGRPRRSGRYEIVNRRAGLDDEMRAAFRSGRRAWGVMALYREEGGPPFSAAEQKVVADLGPAIGEAFRRTTLLQVEPRVPAPHAPGLLMFDASGVLVSMNDEAEAWLRLLPAAAQCPSGNGDLSISTDILNVVNRARAVTAGLDGGVARARLRAASGRWLVIHASCLRNAAGVAEQVAVVIEAATASEMAPIIVEAYALTPREREICEGVSRGEATGELAARLNLSPHTVRDHLKAVFEKVGVSSRGEMVARLFADHYTGGLHTGMVSLEHDLPGAPATRS